MLLRVIIIKIKAPLSILNEFKYNAGELMALLKSNIESMNQSLFVRQHR